MDGQRILRRCGSHFIVRIPLSLVAAASLYIAVSSVETR